MLTETSGTAEQTTAPATAPESRRSSITPTLSERLAEREGKLPVWIRCPKSGPEHYSGFSRAKLYELATSGAIRSVSIRKPGQVRGTRLFHLGSILKFVEECEREVAR